MKWHLDSERTVNDMDTGGLIAFLPEGTSEEVAVVITKAPEMRAAMEEFVKSVDSGSLKARQTYNTFSEILNAIPKY